MTKDSASAANGSGSGSGSGKDSGDVKGMAYGPARPSKFAAAPSTATTANAKSASELQALTKAAAEKSGAGSAGSGGDSKYDEKSSDSKSAGGGGSGGSGLVWYIPSASLDHFESIPNAAARIVSDETGLRVVPTHVQAIEHYPSLRTGNWMRVCVVAALDTSKSGVIDSDRAEWISLSHFPDDGGASSAMTGGYELRRPDIIPVISAYRSGRVARLPLAQTDIGFACTLVEVALWDKSGGLCLIKQSRTATVAAPTATATATTGTASLQRASNWAASITAATAPTTTTDTKTTPPAASEFSLTAASNVTTNSGTENKSGGSGGGGSELVDWWYTLPVTHVTSEETLAFAANRLIRAKFGFLVDIGGVAAIEHNARSDLKLDGVRFTVFADPTPDATDRDPNFVGPPPPHTYVKSVSELDALHRAGRIRTDLYPVIRAALQLPVTPSTTTPTAAAASGAATPASPTSAAAAGEPPSPLAAPGPRHRVTAPLIHI